MTEPAMATGKRRARRVSMPLAYVVVTPIVVLVLMVGVSIGYTRNIDHRRAVAVERVDKEREAAEREADRRWCDLLNLLTRANQNTPPTTELARQYAAAIATLHKQFGCG